MIFDPQSLNLTTLFVDPRMLDSRRAWERAGFDVRDPAKETECMVAAHPSAPGYLFKKYTPDVSPKEQNENYRARIAGEAALAGFLEQDRLQHVLCPRKYLHALPLKFGLDAHVLVVERMDIVGRKASEERFHDIDEPVLRELLRVLVQFRGLDSNSKNIQFTQDGKIAFIDLENWNRPDRKKVRLKSIGEYLSKKKRKLARKILDDLE